MHKKVAKALGAVVISSALIVFVSQQTTMETLTEMSLQISWVQALFWFAIYCLLSGVRAFRFWLMVGKQHFKLVFRAIGIQSGLNRILPFRLGELTLPIWLSPNTTLTTTQILYSLLWVRIIDFSLIIAIGFMGIGVYLQAQSLFTGFVFMVIAIVFIIGLIFIQPNRLGLFIADCLDAIRRTTWGNRLLGHERSVDFQSQLRNLPELNSTQRLLLTISSVGVQATIIALYAVIVADLGMELPLNVTVLAVSSAQLLSVLPVLTMGTLGIHEAGWYAGLNSLGVHADTAVASGIMTQVATLALSLVLACTLYCWKPQGAAPSAVRRA